MIKKQIRLKIFIICCFAVLIFSGCEDGELILMDSDSKEETAGNGEAENAGTAADDTTEEYYVSDSGNSDEDTELTDDDTENTAYIYVFVCGAVKEEGVYELSCNARAEQALIAAGGFTEDADTDAVNLAATLSDGQQLYFPTEEEVASGNWQSTADSSENNGSADTASNEASTSDKVNINTADKEELMTLSGIGEVKAESIISYRETNGSFGSTEDIMNVSGIGESLYQKIKDSITI